MNCVSVARQQGNKFVRKISEALGLGRSVLGGVCIISTVYAAPVSAWVINDEAEQATAGAETATAPLPNETNTLPAGAALSDAANEQLEQRMRSARERYQAQVQQLWPDAMISNAVQWITYSEDYKTRRRVDFRANEIDITVFAAEQDSEDFDKTRRQATYELATVLGTTVAEALQNDPIYKENWSVDAELGEYASSLVFSELFRASSPAKGTVKRMARRLMQRAEVGFFEQKASAKVSVPVKLTKRLTYTIPLPDNRLVKKAKQFRPHILSVANELDVPVDLVYAIIHTESHFNPLARSPIPAYGLMQIVPRTAGRDVTRLLYKESRLLSPAYLFDPERNIKVGATYLRLLYFHYLKDIKDQKSRLYCAIAAYNTGVANVARVFGNVPAMDNAAARINALSSQQVLAALLQSLPARQTRDYLKKVLARKSLYSRV